MRGSIDVKYRRTQAGTWPKPFRVTFYLGSKHGTGKQTRIHGWGNTLTEAINDLARQPEAGAHPDLREHIRAKLGI